jgi:hypothetical protein
LKLLLDEHYAKEIAARLRNRGHDAVSVTERPDLIGLADEDLLLEASSERRALLTENWADSQRELRKNSNQNEVPTTGCDRRVRDKDAESPRTGSTGATEDAVSRRRARPDGGALHSDSSSKAEAVGQAHFGVIFSSRKQFPRGKATVGLYVRTLDDFLSRHPAEDALLNGYRWIPDGPVRESENR